MMAIEKDGNGKKRTIRNLRALGSRGLNGHQARYETFSMIINCSNLARDQPVYESVEEVNELQVSSYYKMLSHFFIPRPSLGQTTGPNWLKFCTESSQGILRGIVEGFFEIRSGGLAMGYPQGSPGGSKILKNFFSIFSIFLTEMGSLMSKSHIKTINDHSFGIFE